MAATLASPVMARDHRTRKSVDVESLVQQLVDDTVALCRTAPRGSRPEGQRNLEKDLTRPVPRGQLTLTRWLTVMLGAVESGVDAGLFPELVADALGAAAATVIPVRDASLAETLTQCHEDPVQELVLRDDASVEDIERALAAARAHRRAEDEFIRSLVRRRLDLLRVRSVA